MRVAGCGLRDARCEVRGARCEMRNEIDSNIGKRDKILRLKRLRLIAAGCGTVSNLRRDAG